MLAPHFSLLEFYNCRLAVAGRWIGPCIHFGTTKLTHWLVSNNPNGIESYQPRVASETSYPGNIPRIRSTLKEFEADPGRCSIKSRNVCSNTFSVVLEVGIPSQGRLVRLAELAEVLANPALKDPNPFRIPLGRSWIHNGQTGRSLRSLPSSRNCMDTAEARAPLAL